MIIAIQTFNHEEFIIQALESVKYQIEKYGKDNPTRLVILDDCSKDSTVILAKKWLSDFSSLFSSVDIIENEENKGTVFNYIEAMRLAKMDKVFIIAGDDLFSQENFYEAIPDKGIMISPTARFINDKIIDYSANAFWKLRNDYKKGKFYSSIKNHLRVSNLIEAPGVFFSRETLCNSELQKHLTAFKFTEDLPTWDYLFNKADTKTEVSFDSKVYILYRQSNGVSTSKKNVNHSNFLAEEEKLLRQIHDRRFKYPLFLNLYYLLESAAILYHKKTKSNCTEHRESIKKAGSHLKYLIEASDNWHKCHV